MGISGSKQKTETKQAVRPVYEGQIKGAANTLDAAYAQQAPRTQALADQIGGLIPSMIDRYNQGDPAVNAARNYVTTTLGGDPASNPYLDDMIAMTGENTRRQTLAGLGTRGLNGGSVAADIVSQNLAESELGARYRDYESGMARRAQAAGMAPGIAAGDLMTISPALAATDMAANLPMNQALKYAAGTGGLLGQYVNSEGNQTTSQSPGLMGIIGTGLQAASLFSDERLKTDIRRVGTTDGELPIYTFRYQGQGPTYMGVMAQDVEEMQPEALGPEVDGYKTVKYEEVR